MYYKLKIKLITILGIALILLGCSHINSEQEIREDSVGIEESQIKEQESEEIELSDQSAIKDIEIENQASEDVTKSIELQTEIANNEIATEIETKEVQTIQSIKTEESEEVDIDIEKQDIEVENQDVDVNNKTISDLEVEIQNDSLENQLIYNTQIEKIYTKINEIRVENNLNILSYNLLLTEVSSYRAMECAYYNYFHHERPNGTKFSTVAVAYGVTYSKIGEILAYRWSTVDDVIQAWMNSEGHKEEILDGEYNEMGVGIASNKDNELYWVVTFK